MRLVTFRPNGSPASEAGKLGALVDGDRRVLSLTDYGAENAALHSMQSLIESGDEGLQSARDLQKKAGGDSSAPFHAAADVKLLLPIRPLSHRQFNCFPGHLRQAYKSMVRIQTAGAPDPEAAYQKVIESGKAELPANWHELPRYYGGNPLSFIGLDDDVVWPRYAELLDYEVEFGVLIWKKGKDIPLDRASTYIFGYTIFNDFSARDMQISEGRYGKAKDFDTGNAMGPCIVTPDELPNPWNLRARARVNGEVRSETTTSLHERTFEEIIAHLSLSQTVYPGEFLAGGTLDGGCGLEFLRFLKPGDVVEIEVEGIGVLRNRIVENDVASMRYPSIATMMEAYKRVATPT